MNHIETEFNRECQSETARSWSETYTGQLAAGDTYYFETKIFDQDEKNLKLQVLARQKEDKTLTKLPEHIKVGIESPDNRIFEAYNQIHFVSSEYTRACIEKKTNHLLPGTYKIFIRNVGEQVEKNLRVALMVSPEYMCNYLKGSTKCGQ